MSIILINTHIMAINFAFNALSTKKKGKILP